MAAPKLRVLYSEDDPDSRELMCLLLAQKGFEVICPDTSQDVLRIAKEEEFDVYLLDTWTPGMSGVELCKRIREFNAQTPIISIPLSRLRVSNTRRWRQEPNLTLQSPQVVMR